MDVALTVLALVVGGLALWWALRLEPHWASRDGRRLTARVQVMTVDGRVEGRWREVRAAVTHDGHVVTRARGLAHAGVTGHWRVVTGSLDERSGRAVYLLRPVDASSTPTERLVLRIPRSSRACPVLDHLAGQSPPTSHG